MRVVVFGGSNGVGAAVVEELARRGHTPVVFARTPQRRQWSEGVQTHAGNVLDAAAVQQAVIGADGAVCTLGLPTRLAIGPPLAGRSKVLSQGTANIVAALQQSGVRRFILETAIATGVSRRQCTPVARLGLRMGLRWLFKEKDRQEQLVQASDLNWTIIRPSALTNGPHHPDTVIDARFKIGLFTQVSRQDVAKAIVDSLEHGTFLHQAITVSRPPRLLDTARWLSEYRE